MFQKNNKTNSSLQSGSPDGAQWLRYTRRRLHIVQYGLILFFAAVCLRLVEVQIVDSGKYREYAQRQYQRKVILPATRGIIFDRDSNVIASNTMFVSFAADPKLAAEDARAIANKFSLLFGKPKKHYLDKLSSDSRFVWLERQVGTQFLRRIDLKKLNGLVVLYEPKRLYHSDHVAGQLIGVTDIDNNGLAGIELEFDAALRGLDGYVVLQRDGLGRARPTVDYPRIEPLDGHSVMLSIDMQLQSIAERELKKGVEANNADRGIVVMMQPQTGEVLAIGQYPPIAPNNFGKYDLQDQKLRAVTDVFEPGSVFKIVTASAALEHHLVKPDQRFFAEHGKYAIEGRSKPILDTHEYEWLTFRDAMAYSSNIVMAKISDVIGSERFYKMAREYGFGIATNIEFPGEVRGSLKKPSEWSGMTLNTMAYGYEVQVTPLQIASAYCAVANGGILMQPLLVKQEIDATRHVVKEYQPQQIRRVISKATADTLKGFFKNVIEYGTGSPTKLAGMSVAGKTGTSKKFVEGRYEAGSYTASFVGFFPVDQPQIVCLVMIDNPRAGTYYGGTTSAPVFRSIAEHVIVSSDRFAARPDAAQATPGYPVSRAETGVRKKSSPDAPALANLASGAIPDVRGLSVRKAVHLLRMKKLEPVVTGSGTVIQQVPAGGQPATAGLKIRLTCQPRSFTALTLN
jgi:cell division protein FtsI (penicillin-binding protein 3)